MTENNLTTNNEHEIDNKSLAHHLSLATVSTALKLFTFDLTFTFLFSGVRQLCNYHLYNQDIKGLQPTVDALQIAVKTSIIPTIARTFAREFDKIDFIQTYYYDKFLNSDLVNLFLDDNFKPDFPEFVGMIAGAYKYGDRNDFQFLGSLNHLAYEYANSNKITKSYPESVALAMSIESVDCGITHIMDSKRDGAIIGAAAGFTLATLGHNVYAPLMGEASKYINNYFDEAAIAA